MLTKYIFLCSLKVTQKFTDTLNKWFTSFEKLSKETNNRLSTQFLLNVEGEVQQQEEQPTFETSSIRNTRSTLLPPIPTAMPKQQPNNWVSKRATIIIEDEDRNSSSISAKLSNIKRDPPPPTISTSNSDPTFQSIARKPLPRPNIGASHPNQRPQLEDPKSSSMPKLPIDPVSTSNMPDPPSSSTNLSPSNSDPNLVNTANGRPASRIVINQRKSIPSMNRNLASSDNITIPKKRLPPAPLNSSMTQEDLTPTFQKYKGTVRRPPGALMASFRKNNDALLSQDINLSDPSTKLLSSSAPTKSCSISQSKDGSINSEIGQWSRLQENLKDIKVAFIENTNYILLNIIVKSSRDHIKQVNVRLFIRSDFFLNFFIT